MYIWVYFAMCAYNRAYMIMWISRLKPDSPQSKRKCLDKAWIGSLNLKPMTMEIQPIKGSLRLL